MWDITTQSLSEAFDHAGVELPEDGKIVEIAARHFLACLLDHPNKDLPTLQAACPSPVGSASFKGTVTATPASPDTDGAAPISDECAELQEAMLGEAVNARTITKVFEAWAATRPLEKAKLVDEWRTAIGRFVKLCGE